MKRCALIVLFLQVLGITTSTFLGFRYEEDGSDCSLGLYRLRLQSDGRLKTTVRVASYPSECFTGEKYHYFNFFTAPEVLSGDKTADMFFPGGCFYDGEKLLKCGVLRPTPEPKFVKEGQELECHIKPQKEEYYEYPYQMYINAVYKWNHSSIVIGNETDICFVSFDVEKSGTNDVSAATYKILERPVDPKKFAELSGYYDFINDSLISVTSPTFQKVTYFGKRLVTYTRDGTYLNDTLEGPFSDRNFNWPVHNVDLVFDATIAGDSVYAPIPYKFVGVSYDPKHCKVYLNTINEPKNAFQFDAVCYHGIKGQSYDIIRDPKNGKFYFEAVYFVAGEKPPQVFIDRYENGAFRYERSHEVSDCGLNRNINYRITVSSDKGFRKILLQPENYLEDVTTCELKLDTESSLWTHKSVKNFDVFGVDHVAEQVIKLTKEDKAAIGDTTLVPRIFANGNHVFFKTEQGFVVKSLQGKYEIKKDWDYDAVLEVVAGVVDDTLPRILKM